MYNSELKNRYINVRESEATLPNNYLLNQFRELEEYENEVQKDVSNFTAYEIIEYYKVRNLHSLESLLTLNSQLSIYTQWCLRENLVKDNQNHFLELDKDVLNSCVNKVAIQQKIISRDTILKWVNELPNPKDQFILLSLFEFGKSKNFADIVYATIYDIDDLTNTLCLQDGRKVKISDQLKAIAYDSFHTDTYYSISGKGVKNMPLVSFENRIVKNYPNSRDDVSDFQKSRVIYNSIVRSLDYVGAAEWCSANSLVESGKIHMIKSQAEKLGITPKDYVYSNHLQEVNQQFGCNIVRSIFSVKYDDYL